MLEASQSIMRIVALSLFTALFAGLWANDHPDGMLAIKHQPLGDPIAEMLYGDRDAIAATLPNQEVIIEVKEVITEKVQVPDHRAIASVQLSGMNKTFSVEGEGLQISEETLQQHLSQLPLGLAAGDYRIVDSLGGVGWLRVRVNGSLEAATTTQQILSTSVANQSVQFIKITQVSRSKSDQQAI